MNGQFGLGIFYALLAGALWGVAPLFLKKGMINSDVGTATLVQQCANVITLIGIGAVEGEMFGVELPSRALWSFIGGGGGESLGKIFYNKGIDEVGASKAVSIKNSDPIVAVLLLMLVLGERVTFPVAVGVGLIVAGIWVFTRMDSRIGQGQGGRSSLIYPFVSVIFYGITPVFKKMGLSAAVLPTLGVLITQLSALLVILSVGRLFGVRQKWQRVDSRSLRFIALSGFVDSLGSLFTFYSLKHAPAVIAAPIWRISPLVAFVLSRFTLKGIGIVVLNDGIAAALIVLGVLFLYQG